MTVTAQPTAPAAGLRSWLTTVDHKRIGIMYLLMALFFFLIGGLEALVIRMQLARPRQPSSRADRYNQIFTMHGTTMVFFVGMPILVGFGNYLVPLQIGARDMAFPRLNALGFWLLLFGGLLMYSSFVPGDGPAVGWFAYAPLTERPFAGSRASTSGRGPALMRRRHHRRRRSTSSSPSTTCAPRA